MPACDSHQTPYNTLMYLIPEQSVQMKKAINNKAKLFYIISSCLIGLGFSALCQASVLPICHMKSSSIGGYNYVVDGKAYHVIGDAADYTKVGVASWYSTRHNGTTTASGVKFSNHGMTAASKVLPLGTKVKVTNLQNGKSTNVTVTDRGPFVSGRIIDLSPAAATKLDYRTTGTAEVQVQAI